MSAGVLEGRIILEGDGRAVRDVEVGYEATMVRGF